MDDYEQKEYKKNRKSEETTKLMNEQEDNYQSHFVENPFIHYREKVSNKQRDGKVILAGEDLEMEAAQK